MPAKKKTAEKAGKKQKQVFATGKRKRAVARASFRPGKGEIRINSKPLDLMTNEILRLKIQEPLILIGDAWKKFNIKIVVKGGGMMGQAEAARQAIAKGLAELLGAGARQVYMDYDRNLLVTDPRRTEPHKSPHSSWGPRRYKQRSKR
jgi:small subunit ribosomal protein S9